MIIWITDGALTIIMAAYQPSWIYDWPSWFSQLCEHPGWQWYQQVIGSCLLSNWRAMANSWLVVIPHGYSWWETTDNSNIYTDFCIYTRKDLNIHRLCIICRYCILTSPYDVGILKCTCAGPLFCLTCNGQASQWLQGHGRGEAGLKLDMPGISLLGYEKWWLMMISGN